MNTSFLKDIKRTMYIYVYYCYVIRIRIFRISFFYIYFHNSFPESLRSFHSAPRRFDISELCILQNRTHKTNTNLWDKAIYKMATSIIVRWLSMATSEILSLSCAQFHYATSSKSKTRAMYKINKLSKVLNSIFFCIFSLWDELYCGKANSYCVNGKHWR